MIEAIENEDKIDAVVALGEIGTPFCMEALCEIVFSDKDMSLRIAAIYNLGRIGDPKAIPFIENFLKTEHLEYEPSKRRIIEVLEKLKQKKVEDVLISLRKNLW